MHRMIFRIATSLAIVAGMFSAGSARAVDIYNNLTQTVNQNLSANNAYSSALSFQTTSSASVITDLQASLKLQAGNTGNTVFSIYDATGSGGTPGTKITDAGSIANNTLTSSYATYGLSGLNISLNPSANYWLVLTTTTSDFIMWTVTSSTTGATGSVGVGTKAGPSAWQVLSQYRAIGVVTAVAVPEPSTYALGAIATGVFALIARRRKARRA